MSDFSSKLGCTAVSPETLQNLLHLSALAERAALLVVGLPGIGKSQMISQEIRRRAQYGTPSVIIDVPHESPDSFGLPVLPKEKSGARGAREAQEYFKRSIPERFRPLIEWCAKMRDEYKSDKDVPVEKRPLLVLEELNRGAGVHVTRCLFVLIEARRFGDSEIGNLVQIVGTMNPSGDGATVQMLENDPAQRRRLTFVELVVDPYQWVRHAKAVKYDSTVVSYVQSYPDMIYDADSFKAGKLYVCPAAWQTVSDLIQAWRVLRGARADDKIDTKDLALSSLIDGKIGVAARVKFYEYIENVSQVPGVTDVLYRLSSDADVQTRLRKVAQERRTEALAGLYAGVTRYLTANKPEVTKVANNIASMLDLVLKGVDGDSSCEESVASFVTGDLKLLENADSSYARELLTALGYTTSWRTVMAKLMAIKEALGAARSAAHKPPDAGDLSN